MPTPICAPFPGCSISVWVSVSAFLSADHSSLEPPIDKWEKKTEMKENADHRPCVRRVCMCVSGAEFYEGERKRMKGADDEGRHGRTAAGAATWKVGRAATCTCRIHGTRHTTHSTLYTTHMTHCTQHTAHCIPSTLHTAHHTSTLLTHIHTTHTARTVHIRSPMVEGSSTKLWSEGGREGAEKYRQTGARGLDTDTQASVCAHTSTQAHGRTGPGEIFNTSFIHE